MDTAAAQRPGRRGGRLQLAAAVTMVVLAFAGSTVVRVHDALADPGEARVEDTVTTAAVTAPVPAPPAPAGDPEDFTVGDLAAGRVPQDVQDRFWQGQLDAILAAPCPTGPAAGGTTITFFLGADETWTARLQDATAAHAEACAA